ncbi:chaperonin 10-like protein [Lasiosphaeris hirsuta]|uniref:Chaperonin 10-like protein n=1 Tax=Lasiosphaeris hirsuta TaxID=260670 RepID=A0AA40B9M3_9PEZI|nr:chaperonin 10-like protein [Lasiosphaeris hirsuta]
MRALILNSELQTATVQRVSAPRPGPGEVLIRVHSIALNPVDALYVAHPLGATGRIVGSDFSGTVVEVAHDPASPTDLAPSQRVAGFLQGACSINPRPGAFAEYLVCPTDLVWRVPDAVSFSEAAAVSLCALTAAQAVFYRLGLSAPFSWDTSSGDQREEVAHGDAAAAGLVRFFIYGASTSVGLYAAQLVRRAAEASGREVQLIGAASKARFNMLRAAPYAYDALVDYRDPDWPSQVREMAGGEGVDFGYDCISEGSTVEKVTGTLREGGKVAVVRSREGRAWAAENLATEPIYGAVWEGLGADVQYYGNMLVRASREARTFAVAFYRWLSDGGQLEANPVRRMPGGLDQVVSDGFALLGSGLVGNRDGNRSEEWMRPISAEKLVYDI